MESQPRNPEFRNNPENFHPCVCESYTGIKMQLIRKFNCCTHKQTKIKRVLFMLSRVFKQVTILNSFFKMLALTFVAC